MNVERTAMFAVCVARGETEGPGLARPGCKARDLICRHRVQGSYDSRIPSRCASTVGVEELVEVACGLETMTIDVGLQLPPAPTSSSQNPWPGAGKRPRVHDERIITSVSLTTCDSSISFPLCTVLAGPAWSP
jgi:hypothetical protein